MERYIWDIFNWPAIEIIHTGLMRVEGAKISKSKSKQEVVSGKFSGWDDPRTWSLQSLRRRGILPKAIRDFCLAAGTNANEITVPIDNLYSENRKLIDMSSNRHFFIQDQVKVRIKGAPELNIHLELHPDIPERGHRNFTTNEHFYITRHDHDLLQEGILYRLMDCLNFRKRGSQGNEEQGEGEQGDDLKSDTLQSDDLVFVDTTVDTYRRAPEGKRIMHWLSADPASSVDVEVLLDDGTIVHGKGEKALAGLKQDTLVQFERFGFCRIDSIEHADGKPLVKCWWTHK